MTRQMLGSTTSIGSRRPHRVARCPDPAGPWFSSRREPSARSDDGHLAMMNRARTSSGSGRLRRTRRISFARSRRLYPVEVRRFGDPCLRSARGMRTRRGRHRLAVCRSLGSPAPARIGKLHRRRRTASRLSASERRARASTFSMSVVRTTHVSPSRSKRMPAASSSDAREQRRSSRYGARGSATTHAFCGRSAIIPQHHGPSARRRGRTTASGAFSCASRTSARCKRSASMRQRSRPFSARSSRASRGTTSTCEQRRSRRIRFRHRTVRR